MKFLRTFFAALGAVVGAAAWSQTPITVTKTQSTFQVSNVNQIRAAATSGLTLLSGTTGNTNIFLNPQGTGGVGIGMGSTAPATMFQVVDTGTASPRGIIDDQYNTGTNSAQLNLRKARGSLATPTTIVTGDLLGRMLFWGHDGTNFIESGNIRVTSSGTIAATRVPSQMEFYTSTNAAPSVLTQWETIFSNGNHTFGGLTTNGTGVIQLAVHTANTGGISLGATQQIWTGATGEFTLGFSGTAAIRINDNVGQITVSPSGTQSTIFTTSGFQLSSTRTAGFGTASGAKIGVSADNTSAILQFTAPTTAGTMTFATGASATALTIGSGGDLTYTATMRVSTDTLSGAGAISVTKDTTKYTSTGVAQALTLADGVDGQIKRIIHDVDGGSGVLTPTTKTGWSTATFTNAGDSLTLEFVTTRGWIVMGSYGTVVAP